MNTITFAHETGAVLQYLMDDFETYSVSCIEHDHRVTADGDIVFDLRDIWDFNTLMSVDLGGMVPGTPFGEFLDDDVLQRWAAAGRFSLEGINTVDVLYKSIHALILPTIAESPDARVADGARKARTLEGTRDALPPYQLRVHSEVFRKFLIDVYHGPFGIELEQGTDLNCVG